MKVFLDTNIFIRFLTKDDESSYKNCKDLLQQIQNGRFRPYTSNIVVMEILFVLNNLYKTPINKAISDVKTLLALRNLVIIERTNTKKALEMSSKFRVKYADCLITAQLERKDIVLCTYDKEFKKIFNGKIKTPEDIIL